MKNYFFFLFLIFVPLASYGQIITDYDVQKIWDEGDHNAFTDLILYNGRFYCSFREGSGHVPGDEDVDGTVRIISSQDGENWMSVALLETEGIDLRDPKLSITPDGRLMVIIGGSDYDKHKLNGRNPYVSFSSDGEKFSDPRPIVIDPEINSGFDWVWRVTWHDGVGYAVDYQYDGINRAYVVKTTDGIHYETISELFISGRPNEATVRFSSSGEMFIYLRREEHGKEGLMLRSKYPFKEYTWVNMEHRLGGPNFLFIPGKEKLVLGTRLYYEDGAKFGLYVSDYQGNQKLIAEFPSAGDTSYPGLLWHDGYLWISYYSSHEEKTNIYLTKIKESDIYDSLKGL